jgi:glycosyltransferase involved in cell wall biosynthesis
MKAPARRESPRTRRTTISACLIVCDEEQALPDALAGVSFCDELIVVDSGSTDATRQLAREAGATVIENPWPGFAAQRNLALDSATSDWVLELDADERVTPELRQAIEEFLASPARERYEIAAMPIRQLFLGKPLAGSARYPDYRHRLLRRGAYRHDETRGVHEGLTAQGPVWILESDLLHLLAGSMGEAVRDTVRYARLESEQIAATRSLRAALAGVVLRPPAKWLARMFVFRGWRDGPRGWLKIWLDCVADVLVWTRYLRSRRKPASIRSGHFAAEHRFDGPPRLVGLASAREAERASAWLEQAQSGGADVSLVTGGKPASGSIRLRHVRRLTPLATLQALDREWQLRPYDALVVFAARPRAVARVLPRRLRGLRGLIEGERADPSESVERLADERGRNGSSR